MFSSQMKELTRRLPGKRYERELIVNKVFTQKRADHVADDKNNQSIILLFKCKAVCIELSRSQHLITFASTC